MNSKVKRDNYLGGNSVIDNIIYYYRYTYILYFVLIFIWNRMFLNGSESNAILNIFILINLLYVAYNIYLLIYKIREKYQDLKYREIRVNFDLFYFTASLFFIGNTSYPFYIIYYIPLLSSINFRENRHYHICSLWIFLYFLILQLLFIKIYQVDFQKIVTDIIIFLFFLIIFTVLLHIFNKRFERKDNELEKMKYFIQKVKYSSNYQEALKTLITQLQYLTGVPIITVMLYDEQKNELFIGESVGIEDSQKYLRLKPGQGVCGNTFKDKEKKIVQDTTDKNNNCGYISFKDLKQDVLSELCFPLILSLNANPIGVLNFESYEKNYFKDEMVHMIDTLIYHIVFILEKSYYDYNYNLNTRKRIDLYRESLFYLRDVVHDWRNKINVFTQLPDYILNKNGDDISVIRDQAKVQAKEVKAFEISLNKALEGKTIYTPNLRKEKLSDIIKKIYNENYYWIRKNNIDFEISEKYDGVKEMEIETDIEWISSVFGNLIINSIYAYERIGVLRGCISLEIIEENSYFRFTLFDNAGGVDEHLLRKINDPASLFVKEGRVGLSLVKKYTNLLKGKIECVNKSNPKGAKFTFIFPKEIGDKEKI
jgi:signal transduction histidine kinase